MCFVSTLPEKFPINKDFNTVAENSISWEINTLTGKNPLQTQFSGFNLVNICFGYELKSIHIDISINTGLVTLSGTVQDYISANEAHDALLHIPGERGIIKNINIGQNA